MKIRPLLYLSCILAWPLFVGVSRLSAAESGPAKVEYTDEQKALLKALDNEIGRFEALLAKDDDAKHAASVKESLEALKARRDTMNKLPFDSGKYDELRFDLNVEYQRMAMWLAPPVAPPPAKK